MQSKKHIAINCLLLIYNGDIINYTIFSFRIKLFNYIVWIKFLNFSFHLLRNFIHCKNRITLSILTIILVCLHLYLYFKLIWSWLLFYDINLKLSIVLIIHLINCIFVLMFIVFINLFFCIVILHSFYLFYYII